MTGKAFRNIILITLFLSHTWYQGKTNLLKTTGKMLVFLLILQIYSVSEIELNVMGILPVYLSIIIFIIFVVVAVMYARRVSVQSFHAVRCHVCSYV